MQRPWLFDTYLKEMLRLHNREISSTLLSRYMYLREITERSPECVFRLPLLTQEKKGFYPKFRIRSLIRAVLLR